MTVSYTIQGRVAVVAIERPERRGAVDEQTARLLFEAALRFDADRAADVMVLTGSGESFCAGADLKALAAGERKEMSEYGELAPMGPTRLRLSKPTVAAIEGYAVAGGLELALWCDLRVASASAVFGVFCRRFGVPLVDLGTVRLPRLIGQSRAADMILTGRAVDAKESLEIGLVNRMVPVGEALSAALELAAQLASFPQACLRSDRRSMLEQWALSENDAMRNEFRLGMKTVATGETFKGAAAFTGGEGRHGVFSGDQRKG